MRRLLIAILALGLVGSACGDDGVGTTGSTLGTTVTSATTTLADTTTSSTGTTTSGDTTTSTDGDDGESEPQCDLPVGKHPVSYSACVMNAGTGEVNVRCGPGTTSDQVGSLAYDATGVQVTGTASAADGGDWYEIEWGSDTAWVSSTYLTDGACTASPPWPLICVRCGNPPPVVYPAPDPSSAELGWLPPNESVHDTGYGYQIPGSDFYYQVHYSGQVGWVSEDSLEVGYETCVPCQWDFPWNITGGVSATPALGPILTGAGANLLTWQTGYEWVATDTGLCVEYTPTAGFGVTVYTLNDGGIEEIHITDPAVTVEGSTARVGDPLSLLGGTIVNTSGMWQLRELGVVTRVYVGVACLPKPGGGCMPFPKPTIREFVVAEDWPECP